MEKEFLQIITENQGIIHKVCSIYCDLEEDRRDLFQEILAQLWKSYPSFRSESKFTTWMYRVALNTAITNFKKDKRQPDKTGISYENMQLVEEMYDTRIEEQIKMLNMAVVQLTGIEKSIILLFLEDKKYEEIAEITGITQNYVRVKNEPYQEEVEVVNEFGRMMDLKDLKSAWNTYSSQEVDKHRLGKENIHEMLKNKTKSLVDRIDRNIRIGMGVLLLFIAYVLFDDLYLSKLLIPDSIKYPGWMIPFDVFSNTLIVTTYLFFVIQYLKIKRNFSIDLQLKDLLFGIRETLKTYRRMFYLAVVILMVNIIVSFTAGVYQGLKFRAGSVNGEVGNLAVSKILMVIGVSLLIIVPMITFSFLILRWGFNKLYGKYLRSLKETLKELDESEPID